MVHRQICLFEQIAHVGLLLRVERGDPNAARAVMLVAGQIIRFAQGDQYFVGHHLCFTGGGLAIQAQALQHHHKFIAPQPRHRVGFTHASFQAGRDLL